MPYAKLTNFVHAINRAKQVQPFVGRILALDPGETTGYAVFDATPNDIDWVEIDQVKSWPETTAMNNLPELFQRTQPGLIVHESYRVYSWKAEDHSWSSVRTVQVIGCIWTLAIQQGIRRFEQSAQNAKGFWDDDKLIEFGLYQRGLRHGRDATRHALHYLCFGEGTQSQPK